MRSIENRAGDACAMLESLTGVPCRLIDTGGEDKICAPAFCLKCADDKCEALRCGVQEAYRWDGRYVFYCRRGLAFSAASLKDTRDEPARGLIAGPMVLGDQEDLPRWEEKELRERAASLPYFDPRRLRALSENMRLIALGLRNAEKEESADFDQARFLSAVYDMRKKYRDVENHYAYILDAEERLLALVEQGDKPGSAELLNELMGFIFFEHAGDFEQVRARVIELVVLMSRTAVQSGADVGEMFRFNTEYIRNVDSFTSLDALCQWVSGIVRQFISAQFDYPRVKHADAVRKATAYILENMCGRVTLADVAREVHLSKSYLSSVFKRETGMNISGYVNRLRVEKSRRLLRDTDQTLVDIAMACGFEDQSYFTKVFGRYVGMSPGRYRESYLSYAPVVK